MRKLLLTNLLAVAFINDISSDVIIQQKLQCSADEVSADEKRCARYGMSCDDISLDVITISSWLSADEAKRERRSNVVLKIQQSVTQLRLFVHLRSLGVLTAAGCGIGSVHAVVRSNLLVEPSEVEEGEISVSGALLVVILYVQEQRAIAAQKLGPEKFYLSHKGDHRFIGGNPSSHKRWMSRFFYVWRVERKRNPWRSMREKCYNALELVKEDLLCHFRFSRKGIELVGDLGERMGKSTLLKTMKECPEEGSSGAAVPLVKVVKKRKAPTPVEKEARRQKKKGASTSEERPAPITEMRRAPMPPAPTPPSPMTHMIAKAISEVPSSEVGPKMKTGPRRAPALNIFEDSLVVSPSGHVATGFKPDPEQGHRTGMSPGAQREANDTRQHFDETLEHCTELEMRLVDLEEASARKERAAEAQREVLEAQGQKLAVERAAMAIEKGVLAAEKEALKAENRAIRIELDALLVNKTAVEEEFVKSSEFDDLCVKRSLAYFKSGFQSCVAQFRANGYSEEEHPAPFLNVARDVEELPDDEEEADEWSRRRRLGRRGHSPEVP
ncbi:Chromatin remodeling complex subunit-like protein isoform 1 [Dorcoceras hygrometricum]|uniref:Chromatin remodeling complex subunit-like protein isoform 1 n=1 Tax=Dorcoceras hygrometricum TaxID=472368 RepID=A0A2Z7D8I3_9LAMI|nr:Chromatin remodeling complex subunit-like protein isoform 1 [Dorcoceras hygrometricum]